MYVKGVTRKWDDTRTLIHTAGSFGTIVVARIIFLILGEGHQRSLYSPPRAMTDKKTSYVVLAEKLNVSVLGIGAVLHLEGAAWSVIGLTEVGQQYATLAPV